MSGEPAAEATAADIRRAAMNLLARREYARAELIRRLEGRGLPAELVTEVAAELVAENLLSDARFAEGFIASRAARGQGPMRIRRELEERGVSGELIDVAFDEAETDWAAQAAGVRRKRFGPALPAEFPEKAKQMRFLQYRGFAPGQIRAAVGDDD